VNRREELADRLAAVHDRIGRACAEVGRDPADVCVIVVTKTFPSTDVRLLAELGVRDIGENRDQEAAPKAAECADLGLRWHFVGQLQTNKAASVATYASAVHSVDRPRLVDALGRAAVSAGRELDCLVQVSLDLPADPGPEAAPADGRPGQMAARGGVFPKHAVPLADRVAAVPSLRLAGVMAIAPPNADPDAAFARLAGVAAAVRDGHPTATWISAGMSGDLEAAVAHGATHLRVGSAILGERPPAG
jgi:hypothetical protein